LKDKKRFTLAVVVCIAVGGLIAAVAEYFGDAYHLGPMASVGEGLIVAGVLAITVDTYLKKHLTQAVIRDVSPYLMGADLPDVLRSEVHALCATEIVRRDLEIDFHFIELPGEPDFISVTTKVQYRIENLADTVRSVPILVSVAKPYKPTADFIQIEDVGAINIVDEKGATTRFEEHASPAADLGADEGGDETVTRFRVWRRSMQIPPHSQGVTTRFWSTTHQILPIEYQDAFVSVHATIGHTVRATYPDSLSVHVQFGHRLYREAHQIPTARPTFWRLDRAFAGRATTMIEWRKRPTPLPKDAMEEIVVITDSEIAKPAEPENV
jgi:hypothetical protein